MTIKRFLSFAIFVALIGIATGAYAARSGFLDTDGTKFDVAFATLKEKGVIQGYADGYARPDLPLNRVEALKIIEETHGGFDKQIAYYKQNMPPIALFRDTDQGAWYGPYIEVGFQYQIISGYPDGTFRPGQFLRTEEAVTMLMRAFEEEGDLQEALLSPSIENEPNQWFTASINAAIDKNLVMHTERLQLGRPITRGQFIDMVYRLDHVREKNLLAYREPEPSQPSQQGVTLDPDPALLEPTGVTQTDGIEVPVVSAVVTVDTPRNVVVAPKIDHPYASEKYFAISMPSLGIEDLAIIHPEDPVSRDGVLAPLKDGVGHLFAYPGGGGKIMVYGHSSGYPWDVSEYTKVFRKINELQPGDRVYVTYAGTLYVYEVTHEQTILAKETGPFQDDGSGEELILYTCWPPDSIAQRYLVHAVPVETIAAR